MKKLVLSAVINFQYDIRLYYLFIYLLSIIHLLMYL